MHKLLPLGTKVKIITKWGQLAKENDFGVITAYWPNHPEEVTYPYEVTTTKGEKCRWLSPSHIVETSYAAMAAECFLAAWKSSADTKTKDHILTGLKKLGYNIETIVTHQLTTTKE
jgi:hypothetical protein